MIRIVRYRLRQDALPILLFVLTFMVMSYPFVFRMGDSLPMENVDTHTALWQNWWVLESFSHDYSINHSPLLFHPTGLDVTLQPRRWASLPIWIPLYLAFGDPLAFNLTAMIGILFKAYGMYLFCLWLFKNRIPAWVSGAFYAFAASSLQLALQQPNTGATEWIPWFMLAFLYGLSQIKTGKHPRRILLMMVLAGFLFALNAFMNLKIALFAMLLGGGFVLLYMLAQSLWRVPLFWLAMVIFGSSALGFSSPILVPAIGSTDIESAIGDGVVLRGGIDILSYVKAEHQRPLNYMQSIASLRGEQLELQNIYGMSHVGIVSIAFVLMGLLYAIRAKRILFIWVILGILFWSLSLGIEIHFRRNYTYLYWSPYRVVQDNILFLIVKFPYRMTLLFLFPYSILVGYGLNYRLRSLELTRKQWVMLILSVVMLLYGTSIFPIPTRPAPRPDYVDTLEQLSDGAVIDLPFGRHNSKYYMSVQRFHDRPIIEGMIARMPPDAYDYVDANPLLAVIRGKTDLSLDDMSLDDWQMTFKRLSDDGFRYLILHKSIPQSSTERPKKSVLELFSTLPAVYEDDEVLIYDVDTLRTASPPMLE